MEECDSGNNMIVVYSCQENECIQKNSFIENILERERFLFIDEHLQEISMTKFLNQCRDQPCILSLVCEHIQSVFLCYQKMLDKKCMQKLVVGTWVNNINMVAHVIYLEYHGFEQSLLDTIQHNLQQRNIIQSEDFSGAEKFVEKAQSIISAKELREEDVKYDDCNIALAEGDIKILTNNITKKIRNNIEETVNILAKNKTCPERGSLTSGREKRYTRTLKSHQTSEKQSKFTLAENIVDSQSDYSSKLQHFCDISFSRRKYLMGQNRFLSVSTLEPLEEVVGMHVWEAVCLPEETALPIPSMIPQAFNNRKDRDLLSKFIMGRHIPVCIHENSLSELAELLLCDCMIIKSETIDKIEIICFRSSVLMCDQEEFIKASQFVFTSLLTNIGDGPTVRDLTYSLILLLSMLYLRALTHSTSAGQQVRFTRELLNDFVHQLSKRESQNNLGEFSRGFIRGLEIFLRSLSCRIEKEDSILQMGDWDQALKRESNTKFLAETVSKMDISEQITLTFLLINTLNRLGSSVVSLAGLLADIAPQIIAPYKKKNKEQKRAVSQMYRYFLARSCKHILLHQKLSNVSGKNEFIEQLKKLIQLTMDTKDCVKEAVCDNYKSLVFHKNRDIRKLIISKTNVLENLRSTSFEYITHQLRKASLSLHAHSVERRKSGNLPAWAKHVGSMGTQQVDVWCLIPSNQCILDRFQEDYKDKADKRETDAALNTLETLRSLQRNGTHGHVIQLFAYQCLPMPLFFVVENPNGVKLLKYLIFRRENKEWLNYCQLAHIVSGSLKAIIYLHDNDVLHRDITTAQFKICPDSLHVKLKNFRVSKITPNKQDLFYIADREMLAVRWLARESLLYDKFSLGTDIWMFGHFILEIFTHGCWPFTEHRDKDTGDIMEMVIKGNLTPRHPPCVPDVIFKVILRCFDEETKRMTTKELAQILDGFISGNVDTSGNGKENLRSVWMKSEQYPPISLAQKRKKYLPEWTIPTTIQSMKITGDSKYYNICEGQNVNKNAITEADLVTSVNQPKFLKRTADLVVTEQLSELAINSTIPNRQTLKKIMGIETIDISYENEGYIQMIYRYPLGCSLRDFAIQTQDNLNVLEALLKLAKCIQQFHRARWLVRCISARDVWIGQNEEVYFLRLSRACPMPGDVEWVIGEPFEDRLHWMPPEILHSEYDKMYTTASDIYQFGMTAFEVHQILSLPDGCKASLSSVPLSHISRYKLLDALHKGHHPPQPSRCPNEIYEIMKRCWYRERIRRPGIDEIVEKIETLIGSSRLKNDTVYKWTKFNRAEMKGTVNSLTQSNAIICHDINIAETLKFHTFVETNQEKCSGSGMVHKSRSNPDYKTCNTYTGYSNCHNGERGENEGPKRLYENAHIVFENGTEDESPSVASSSDSVRYVNNKFDDDSMNQACQTLPREARSRRTIVPTSVYAGSNEGNEHCYDNAMFKSSFMPSVRNKMRKRSKSMELRHCMQFSSTNQEDTFRNEYIVGNEDNKHQNIRATNHSGAHNMNNSRNSMPLTVIPFQTHPFFIGHDDEKYACSVPMSESPKSSNNQSVADEAAYLYRDFESGSMHALDVFKSTGTDTSQVPVETSVADEKVHVYDYAVFGEDNQTRISGDNVYFEASTQLGQHQIYVACSKGNEKMDLCFNDGYLEPAIMLPQHANSTRDVYKERTVSNRSIQDRRSSQHMSDSLVISHIDHTLCERASHYKAKDFSDVHNERYNAKGSACRKYQETRRDIKNNGSTLHSWPQNVFANSRHIVSDISGIECTGNTLGEGTTLYEKKDVFDICSFEDNAKVESSKRKKENASNSKPNDARAQECTRETTAISHKYISELGIAVTNITGHTLGEGTTLYAIKDITESIV